MKQRIFFTSLAVTLVVATAASAQQPVKPVAVKPVVRQAPKASHTKAVQSPALTQSKGLQIKESQPGLLGQTTVSVDKAISTAQKAYPGTIVSEQLEKRGNELLYRFGIRGSNHQLHHVLVDAKTGVVVKAQAHATSHKPPTGKTEK